MKQQYDSYRTSGIDWIGDIPSHWSVSKLKYHIYIDSGDYISKDEISDDNTIPVFGGGEQIGYAAKSNVSGNTIIIGRVGARCGCVTPIIQQAWATDNSLICIPKKNFKFLYYLLLAANLNKLNESNAQPLITSTKVKNLIIGMPPLVEQEAIAAWLDEKCEEIDAAIAKVDREIELIEELKQSEISRVVTRGLNPDAHLRPSGIDWIGNIPSHWKVCKLNRILDGIQDGTHATLQRVDDGYPLLSAKNVFEDGIHISENESCISTLDYNEIISNGYPKKGDIALCCVATIGRGCIYPFDYHLAFQRSVTFLRINSHYSNSFILYYLRSVSAKAQFDTYAKTSAQSGVYMGDLKRFFICLPPLPEQQAIADYLDKKCAEIDGLKAKLTKKRETLTELRQSIISEVVTGKRKVI